MPSASVAHCAHNPLLARDLPDQLVHEQRAALRQLHIRGEAFDERDLVGIFRGIDGRLGAFVSELVDLESVDVRSTALGSTSELTEMERVIRA